MLKRILYHKLENYTVTNFAPRLRRWGQSLIKTGTEYCGDDGHSDKLVKSLRCVPLNNKVYPKLLSADWVAPNATVIGDVKCDVGSSIWHTAVLRGDTAKIRVGKNTLIQDRAFIKASDKGHGHVKIGNNVFVGPNVQLDSCHLEDFSYVGMGATLHKNVTVESYGIVAAGAVVPEGTTVVSGQVWAGTPATYLRDVTQEEKHQISEYLIEMQQLSHIYNEETEKEFREVLDEQEDKIMFHSLDPLAKQATLLKERGFPTENDDVEYISDLRLEEIDLEPDAFKRSYNPYEQDLSRFPEIYQMYGENFEKYQKVKERFANEKPGGKFGEAPIIPKKPKDQSPWEKKYDDYMPRYRGESFQ